MNNLIRRNLTSYTEKIPGQKNLHKKEILSIILLPIDFLL